MRNKIQAGVLGAAMGVVVIAAASAVAQAATWTPWWFLDTQADYPNPVTKPGDLIPGTSANFIWFNSTQSATTGSEPPYQAQFQWATHSENIVSAKAKIIADDFFALYVGGTLVPGAYAWLDDLPVIPGTPHRQPMEVDLTGILTGPLQFFQIYACDGFPSSPRDAPPASLDDANLACPGAAAREYHYVLFDMEVTSRSLVDGSLSTVHEVSRAGWDARTLVDVPAPATLALLGVAGILLPLLRRATPPAMRDQNACA